MAFTQTGIMHVFAKVTVVKLNLPKPVKKYLLMALAGVGVFILVYAYVKFTNDRVYDFAREQVLNNDSNPDSAKQVLGEQTIPSNTRDHAKALTNNEAIRSPVNDVKNKANSSILIAGKSAHSCMRELNTTVINNEVVKCTRDHYIKLGDKPN